MLKSMTGFGRGEYFDNEHHFVVELKAVNHRFNEIVVRMPRMLSPLEDKIRRLIMGHLTRGRVDVNITVDEYCTRKKTIRVDKELAIAYHNTLKELANLFSYELNGSVIKQISMYSDVIKVDDQPEDMDVLWPKLSEAVEIALDNLMRMRIDEGANITRDLSARLDRLQWLRDQIEAKAPEIVSEYRDKLFIRMKDILSKVDVQVDEGRILQEAALFADRINFTEELVRLKSHFLQFTKTMETEVPVGRKLDFLVQEFNREANTIASKANNAQVAQFVVEMKSEIEKVREQIQNIE